MQGACASAQVGVTKQALGRSSSHPRTLAREEWGGEQDPALARGFLWELKESWAGALKPLESHLPFVRWSTVSTLVFLESLSVGDLQTLFSCLGYFCVL